MRHLLRLAIVAAGVAALAAPARAQDELVPVATGPTGQPMAGWTFTPSLVYSGTYDDNVLVEGDGANGPSDVLNMLGPRADLGYGGKRTRMALSYDGGFLMYRDFNTLNSYDQHALFSVRRLVTKHVALFARDTFAAVPTTALMQFVGVPFVRTGSRMEDAQGGVDAALTKRTSIIATYDFQWVQFDDNPQYASLLLGGHSHGGAVSVRHVLNDLTTLTGDYDVQHAIVADAAQTAAIYHVVIPPTFDIQNAEVGLERKLTDMTTVFASGGVSRLMLGGETQTGPAWRVGMTHTYRDASAGVTYSRSFVPQYGFGGTLQNEEVTGNVSWPLARRIVASGAVAWRRNAPLTVGELNLDSIWIQAGVAYAISPWLQLEGFYSGVRQTIDQPGGDLHRNVFGFQFTTAKTMRIR